MRLKPTYNFLGSGCLFYYRDIFSGLSNETVGAASYNFLAMDHSVQQLIATVNHFQRLLLRYSSLIVKNKLVSYLIIEDVFDEYSKQVNIIAPSEIRLFLSTTTQQKCEQWLVAKAVTLNLRKPKNPT
jgi:hypothetical protein